MSLTQLEIIRQKDRDRLVEIHSDILPEGIEIDMKLLSESVASDRELEWEETEFNCRLIYCEVVNYAGLIGAVAHVPRISALMTKQANTFPIILESIRRAAAPMIRARALLPIQAQTQARLLTPVRRIQAFAVPVPPSQAVPQTDSIQGRVKKKALSSQFTPQP